MTNKFTIKDLITEVTIAAIYVVLVLAFYFMSFEAIQFRIAEIMLVLVFFNKKHTIGIVTGTFIANWIGIFGIVDALFGASATLLVCIFLVIFKKHWIPALIIFPALFNGIIVSIEISLLAEVWDIFLANVLWISLGELVVMVILGIPFKLLIEKMKLNETLHLN